MKPMLAAKADLGKIEYPVYASAKLDGVRAVVVGGKLLSRSLKPIPNAHVNKLFSRKELNNYDGELIVGDPWAKDVYRQTVGAVRRDDGTPQVTLYLFDNFSKPEMPFAERMSQFMPPPAKLSNVLVLPQHLILNETELLKYEKEMLDIGYEGLILRSPDGAYKFGRSTAQEGGMLKLKRFTDAEAEVIGIYEEMENTNEKKTNELGRGARSSAKAGKVPKGRAGGLHLRKDGVDFDCGTGLDDSDRAFFWKHRDPKKTYTLPDSDHVYYAVDKPGRLVKFKSFLIGVKDKPRHPVYLGGREVWDL